MDNTPVTNAEFRRFVRETGHVSFAEITPDPKDYPGALPHLLRAGSLVFVKSKGPVDLTNCSLAEPAQRRLRGNFAGRHIPAEWLWTLRHDWQCLGVDDRLLCSQSQTATFMLHAGQSARPAR
jgi:hypothetical protein